MKNKTLELVEKFLNSFEDYEKTTGYSYSAAYFNLDRIKYLLNLLDNPHLKIPSVHITGTKGKGSTAYFTASILESAGLKTGLYTSPHILTFRERIKINMEMISWDELNEIIKIMIPAVKKLEKETKYGKPTFFEVYTAIAFLCFYNKKVDVMVLEVGMGGRLDATNVVTPVVSIITSISLDHVKELGDTVLKIAKEKSGIIKNNSVVVTAPQDKAVLALLRDTAEKKDSKYYEAGNDIEYNIKKIGHEGIEFSVNGLENTYNNLKTKMIGTHQVINASLAIAASEIFLKRYLHLNINLSKIVKKGIKKALIPGRIQIVSKKPYFVMDSAHNEASAKALMSSLGTIKYRKLIMVVGMSINKDIKAFLSVFIKVASKVIFVKSTNYRSAPTKEMEKVSNFKSKASFDSVKKGIKYAKKIAKKKDLICVTGSFYVLYDAAVYLKKNKKWNIK